jgi:hypothetical protein
MKSETELRAIVAMRDEDLRIATKHRIEAAARIATESSTSAYRAALRWEATCREHRRLAGCALRDGLQRLAAFVEPPASTQEVIDRAAGVPSSTAEVIGRAAAERQA